MKPKKLLNKHNKMKKNKNKNKNNKVKKNYIYLIEKYFIFNNYIFLLFF